MYGSTPQAVLGTHLQYIRGYRAAVTLLQALGDTEGAQHAQDAAARLIASVPGLPTGVIAPEHNWQISAVAVQIGLPATAEARQDIWTRTFSHVKQDSPADPVISPYFNLAVLDAMASLGHGHEALDWLRIYWGGMLAEDATSFWESYDLRWPKDTPHLSLQADGTSGFFVSLAHGWSAGPTAWLTENLLGVRDPAEGYRTVTLAPRLLGLDWAKGSVPTPHGAILVSLRRAAGGVHVDFDLPTGVEAATLALEASRPGTDIILDGHTTKFTPDVVPPTLHAGHHTLFYSPAAP